MNRSRRPHGRLGPWVVTLALAVLTVGRPAPAFAQVEDPSGEEVDSARIRVLERLRNLSKPPGVDSTLFVADSTPGQARVAPPPPPLPQAADSFMAALLALPRIPPATGAPTVPDDRGGGLLRTLSSDPGRAVALAEFAKVTGGR